MASRKTMSAATPSRTFGSGESMKLPPYLTTKVEPRKRCTYGNASSNTSAFLIRSCINARLLLSLVQLNVFLRQIAGVHRAMAATEMQMDVDHEGRLGDDLAQLCQRRPRGHAAAKRGHAVVSDVHEVLVNFGPAVAERVEDPSPIRVATAPTCLHEHGIGDGPRRNHRVAFGSGPVDVESHEFRRAFAIAHDHLREFEAHEVECFLELPQRRRAGHAVGEEDH